MRPLKALRWLWRSAWADGQTTGLGKFFRLGRWRPRPFAQRAPAPGRRANKAAKLIRVLLSGARRTGAIIVFLTAMLLASALVESGRFALAAGAFAAIFIAIELLGRKFGWFIE